jgi:hypothetical protein
LFQTIEEMAKDRGLSIKMWISFADAAPQNLNIIEKILGSSGLSIQPSGVRWSPLVVAATLNRTTEPVQTFTYPLNPPSGPNEIVQLARDVAIGLGTGIASAFIYDAFKSWIEPKNQKRISAKLGNLELSTSEVSVDEFRKLFKALHDVKEEADIRAKIVETGIKLTVIELPESHDKSKK